ncbi:MAG: glycoside hydrolase family 2 [Bacteroidales bacterium]|nr:glycoside hydrolase family 2 [Bacteroidales bacterium]
MKQRLLILLLLLCATTAAQTPDSCRPFVRWWWNGDKVDTLELKRELHLLHEAGIGGVEINPIEFPSKRCESLGIPSLTWLGDEWLEALGSTLREAKRLGMQCDLLVGSGWPFGMETLPMEYRAQVMLTYAIPVDLSERKTFTITRQQIFDAVDPKVTEPNPDRQFELVDLFIVPDSITDIRQMIKLVLPGDSVTMKIENSKLIIANYPDAETNAKFSILNSQFQILNSQFPIPDSQFYMYALVRCTSFASVINGAPGASGPILDHMNRQAVLHYLNHMSSTLQRRLGPMKNWLRAYFVDSMELEGSNWTDDFAEEFRRRNGYDLMPWLPFVLFPTGRLGEVTSYDYGAHKSPEMERKIQMARLHFERTKAQLLHERFTTVFADWCRGQGVKSRGQAYGRGFFPLLSSTAYDIPEGESWTTNYLRHRIGEEMPDSDYRRGRAYTMINKYVSSAAHHNGRRLVSAEEMTNTYRMFETTLELLKLGSDMSAISGITHSVWHGFNYSPPQAGFPGWVQYGSYLNEQNTWWPYFHLLNEYRSRMSAILQNADMQTDIAILLPVDSLWAQYGVQTEPFPNYPKGSPYDIPFLLWEAVHKNGGNCDFVTPSQLDTATVRDGKLIVGKRAYSTLLVPPPITWDPSFSICHFPFSILEVPDLPDRNYLEWYRTAQSEYKLPHAVAIEEPDRYLLQNHYRNDRGDDIFLFVNACLRSAVGSTILFPKEIYQHRTACVYNAATDEKQLLELDDGAAWLYLPPAESLFILFESTDTLTHSSTDTFTHSYWSPAYHEGQHYFPLHTEWHLSLHHAIEGWTHDTVMQQLCDLRETTFNDFSGTLTYTAQIPFDSIGPNPIFDLGQVYDICELIVNGTSCGVKWYGERIYYNAAPLLHPGLNTIQVRVTTTLNNYVHTLTDDKVIQHYILKRNVPTTPAGLLGIDGQIAVF